MRLSPSGAKRSRVPPQRKSRRGLKHRATFRLLSLVALLIASPGRAQTVVLDNFNSGTATGSVLPGTSWANNVTQNATSITIGGTATDVNGWSATGQSLSTSGMKFLTVTAQRGADNAAPKFAVQFEDPQLNTHVVTVNTAVFAVGAPTKVQIPLPPAPAEFSATQISSWSLGGGGLGTALLHLTLDLLSFDSVLDPNSTLAPLGTVSYTAPISGTSGLTLNGSGTLVLGAANTFTGDVVLTQGTLQLGAAGALPTGAPVNLASGSVLDLAGFGATLGKLEGAGAVTLGAANLTVAQSSNTTFSGAISGTGGLAKSGSGILTLTGTHTFTGATSITGGQLKLNGSAPNSAFTVSGGTLTGSGTVGPLTIALGGTLAPGNSPGTLSAGDTTWAGGGSFEFEINRGTGGTAGSDPGWDLLSISGSLNITATSGNRFTVGLNTLDLSNNAGAPANVSESSSYTFAFVTTTTGIVGFDADKFTLSASGVHSSLLGTWSIGQSGNTLNLMYTGSAVPEPSTSAAIVAFVALAFAAWRRRRL